MQDDSFQCSRKCQLYCTALLSFQSIKTIDRDFESTQDAIEFHRELNENTPVACIAIQTGAQGLLALLTSVPILPHSRIIPNI